MSKEHDDSPGASEERPGGPDVAWKAAMIAKARRCWHGMKTRCYNPQNPAYKHYGRRGIRVCDRWRLNFDAFLEDMGPPPSARHSIDRIDNDRGYEPDNCRWATPREQGANKRSAARIRHMGEFFSSGMNELS
jgi:hypothetical protein